MKVGCDFSLEFFGMAEGEVSVTITAVPPSGDGETIATFVGQAVEAQGSDPSGSLDIDLTDALRDLEPAVAEDYDFKVRVDATVKSTDGNSDITKSANLFIICDTSGDGDEEAPDEAEEADEVEKQPTPVGGVAAGMGGANDAGAAALDRARSLFWAASPSSVSPC